MIVSLADYATGDEIPLIVCYLPTIIVMCWVSHLAVAVSLAMICCTGWLVDDLIFLDEWAVTPAQYWTASTHFLFFLVIISLLARLRLAHSSEENLARYDVLTGLMNGRAFREAARLEMQRAARTDTPLGVVYIDCDNFKGVNDTQSHLEGDRLLKSIGETLRNNLRAIDVAARLGGDEFAILLPGVTLEEAELAIERLRGQLDQAMRSRKWPVTFSVGVMIYENAPESVEELIYGADALMLEVKRQQKDGAAYRICV